MDLSWYLRNLVVGVDTKVPLTNGEYVTAINFDNAATTPPFYYVMQEIINFVPWYSSIHRGKGYKSVLSSNLYEKGRKVIKNFVKADEKKDDVIYTKNTTESINMLSYMLKQDSKKNIIISTNMEHLANDLPWKNKFKVEYVKLDEKGKLSIEDLEHKLVKNKGKVKLVTVTAASNVSGYVNPYYKIAELAHKYGAEILVDGAQIVAHDEFDMKPHESMQHIDYFVFSSHKMYAPFGVGVLIGNKEIFNKTLPEYNGGGTVRFVSHKFIEWHDSPDKHEAGTPNVIGVVALIAAIKTLNMIGMKVIHDYEDNLIRYAIENLKEIPDIKLYGYDKEDEKRVSLISFNMDGVYDEIVSEALSKEAGIAVRNGLFCAHVYVEKLMNVSDKKLEYYHKNHDAILPGMVRISLGLYNTYYEIDKLIEMLKIISNNKEYYNEKYKDSLL